MYFLMMHTVFRYEKAQVSTFTQAQPDQYPGLSKQQAILRYMIAAVFVVVAGSLLPSIGKAIAQQMGWYESFVGTMLIAFATSLPEIVVTAAALRLGAVDMAIGNLLGSNLFNIAILAIDDVLYSPGPLFDHVSPIHAVSAFSAMMMTSVAIVGLFYHPQKRFLKLVGWVSIFLCCTYLVNTYIMFMFGR